MSGQTTLLFRTVFYSLWSLTWLIVTLLVSVSAAWKAPAYATIEILLIFSALTLLVFPCFRFGRALLEPPAEVCRRFFTGWIKPVAFISALSLIALLLWPKKYPLVAKPAEKVAVIGGGSAGIHAAWMLHQNNVDFELFEAADYIGGHALASDFVSGGKAYPVDIGFIFGAPSSYKEFKTLLALHDIERTQSILSYYGKVKGVEWATDAPETVTAEAERFHKLADAEYNNPALNLVPFGWWLKYHGFSEKFRETHLTPMLAILFVSIEGFYEQSTRFILNMFAGDGKWVDYRYGATSWVIRGTSKEYYKRLTAAFKEKIHLLAPVTRVTRNNGKVTVTWIDNLSKPHSQEFSSVIMATPADVARRIIDTEWWENWTLAQARYTPVIVDLHSDTSVLPPPKLRRAFHYVQHSDDPLSFELSGRMAEIFQYGNIDPEPIITLNPQHRTPHPLLSRVWRHHTQDLWHIAVMDVLLTQMQGRGNIYYAGDWVKFIGHGQAMRTGMHAACKISGVKDEATLKANPQPIPCRDVTVVDKRKSDGREKKIRVCSVADAYRYITAMACPEFYPENQRIEP